MHDSTAHRFRGGLGARRLGDLDLVATEEPQLTLVKQGGAPEDPGFRRLSPGVVLAKRPGGDRTQRGVDPPPPNRVRDARLAVRRSVIDGRPHRDRVFKLRVYLAGELALGMIGGKFPEQKRRAACVLPLQMLPPCPEGNP